MPSNEELERKIAEAMEDEDSDIAKAVEKAQEALRKQGQNDAE